MKHYLLTRAHPLAPDETYLISADRPGRAVASLADPAGQPS
jgi:hypothetical protein